MDKIQVMTLFTGIGGFDLAAEDAGMQVVAMCEIDPAARKISEEHFPNAVMYHDVKKVGRKNVSATIDVICGGFPCQDLSIAGKRAGLVGERSGLWYEFARIIREFKPGVVVVENVPGLLSSNDGKDFAIVIGGLTGVLPKVPAGGWQSAGIAWGPRYKVSWRVCDAQYFGLAQRRKRVFIVASLGNGSCAQVLFESDGLYRNTPPGIESREGTATAFTVRSRKEGGGKGYLGSDELGMTLGGWLSIAHGQANAEILENLSPTLNTNHEQPIVVRVAFDGAQIASKEHGSLPSTVSKPLNTLGQMSVFSPIAFQPGNLVRGAGSDPSEIVFPTLGANTQGDQFPHVAWEMQYASEDETLRHKGINGINREGDNYASTQEGNPSKILSVLREEIGKEAFTEWGLGILDTFQSAEVLRTNLFRQVSNRTEERCAEVVGSTQAGEVDVPERELLKVREDGRERRTPQGWKLEQQFSRKLGAYLSKLPQQRTQSTWFLQDMWEASEGIGLLREALSAFQEIREPFDVEKKPARSTIGIRRLTPKECERLMGFPIGWTDGQADSKRYKQLGNAVAVPVVTWIMKRIARYYYDR